MNVGSSAEEFISNHALGRETCVILSSVTSSQKSVFRPLGDDREFSTHQPPNVFFNRSLIGARHKSPVAE